MYLFTDLGNANLSNIAKYICPVANIAKIFLPHCTPTASFCLAVIVSWLKAAIQFMHNPLFKEVLFFPTTWDNEQCYGWYLCRQLWIELFGWVLSFKCNQLSKRFFSFPQHENMRSTVMDDIHHNTVQSLLSLWIELILLQRKRTFWFEQFLWNELQPLCRNRLAEIKMFLLQCIQTDSSYFAGCQ